MQKQKKIPQRKCIACQDRDAKRDLVRIVKNKEGQIFLDKTGKANGRGAYICNCVECLNKAIKTKRFEIAKEVLLMMTRDIKYGLVPNGYSGYDNRPLYNSVDSL